MSGLLYASLDQVVFDLGLPGLAAAKTAKMVERIAAASVWLTRKTGNFIPVLATQRYAGPGGRDLRIDPLLAVTTLADDGYGVTLTTSDYVLYPRNRYWTNGPYTRIAKSDTAGVWSCGQDLIVVTGAWGKYLEQVATGATLAADLTSSATALPVDNGALLSPGMVLLLGTEQIVVEGYGARSAATSKLNGVLDATSTSVVVDNGAEFYIGEVLRVNGEDLRIEDIATNTLLVTRKWNETDAASHADDAAISVQRTYTVTRGVNGTTAAAHAQNLALARYVPPGDVNWLVRQIAGLMHNKARGGFAGKSGSAELGEIFYHDEFPKKQVEDVVRNYRITSL